MSDLILYTSEDGETRLDLRVDAGTIWLTQLEQITAVLNYDSSVVGTYSGSVVVDNLDITTQGGAAQGANDQDDIINLLVIASRCFVISYRSLRSDWGERFEFVTCLLTVPNTTRSTIACSAT